VNRDQHSPLSSSDLNDLAAWPFGEGADEITIRISRYNDDGSPASYQTIVRGKDRTKVWGVGVRKDPISALHGAIKSFFAPKPGSPVGNEQEEVSDLDVEDLLS
jgi:hypothetical protein